MLQHTGCLVPQRELQEVLLQQIRVEVGAVLRDRGHSLIRHILRIRHVSRNRNTRPIRRDSDMCSLWVHLLRGQP